MNTTDFHPSRIVMLVDNCPIVNYVNKKTLLSYGFTTEVLTYRSGPKALQHLTQAADQNQIPEYIFVNLNMRIMDGNKFSEEYDKLPYFIKQKTKLVLLSSSINPEQIKEIAKNRNVFAHLSTPLIKSNIDELLAIKKQFAFAA